MLANACLRKYLGPELATGHSVYAADRVALHRKQYATGQRVYTADRLALHKRNSMSVPYILGWNVVRYDDGMRRWVKFGAWVRR